ncbi:MAG TPA: carbohydrate ABC transporter permease [Candidatus Borkfalkia avicola]|uniref:Carbohydrate ABC transporter permease n=1 Tax=Candidatus Borkfalkia avicola TaxID=2838503 RepID=A0A9D2IHD5_9FIRM|nr:carbohydrate ABC transporter permease [Candidatus Borkfalkia avicola]
MKKIRMNRVLSIVFLVFTFIVLIFYAVSLLYPLFWTFYSSFKDVVEYTLHPFDITKSWHFENYIEIFSVLSVPVVDGDSTRNVYILEMLLNSLIYTCGVALLNVFVPSLTAYVVSKYRFRGRSIIYAIAIVTMILPIVGALPSSLRIMEGLNLRNNFLGVWLMLASGFGFNFLIIYSTFNSLSWSYGEAALIDGASDFKVYWKIMMPLIYPTLSGLFVLAFVSNWNDYMTPLVYLAQKPTMAYGVFQFQFLASSLGYTTPHVLAGFIISMIPILILFFIFQDKIMNNVTAGGLKG